MEVHIQLLRLVLVMVDTKFVMIHRSILPLSARFDTEKLHKVLDLNFRVLSTQGIASTEESVFHRRMLQLIFRRPFFHICSSLFLVVLSVFLLATLFFISVLITVLVIIAASLFAIVILLILVFGIGVLAINNALHGRGGRVMRWFLNCFAGSKGVNLGKGLWSHQLVIILNGCRTWQIVPADEIGLMVCHVMWGEEGSLEGFELLIRIMNQVVIECTVLLQVTERNRTTRNSYFFNKIS